MNVSFQNVLTFIWACSPRSQRITCVEWLNVINMGYSRVPLGTLAVLTNMEFASEVPDLGQKRMTPFFLHMKASWWKRSDASLNLHFVQAGRAVEPERFV